MAGRPPKEKSFANMLRIAINEAAEQGGTKLRAVADALVTKAMEGDVVAIKEVADRLDGKSVATLETEVTHSYVARIPEPATDADEWQKQHAPQRQTMQ